MIRVAATLAIAAALSGCWQKDVGRSYYANGKVRSEASVKNYVLDGAAVMYFENGNKMSEAHYRAGVLDGKSIAYYENGQKKAQAEYKDGLLHGTSISWAENGQVLQSARFEQGRPVPPQEPQAAPPATPNKQEP